MRQGIRTSLLLTSILMPSSQHPMQLTDDLSHTPIDVKLLTTFVLF